MKTLISALLITIMLAAGLWTTMSYITYDNQFQSTLAEYDSAQKDDLYIFEDAWMAVKTFSGQTDDFYKEWFKNTYYSRILNPRDGGAILELVNWCVEQNENVTEASYLSFMDELKGTAAIWEYNQARTLRLYTELVTITTETPSSWFLSGRTVDPPTLIITPNTITPTPPITTTGGGGDTNGF